MPVTLMRSKLFVPGSRPELFAKALAGEADGISIDLEDAVEESRKAEARGTVAAFLRAGPPASGKVIIVRVNGRDTPHFGADLEAIAWPAVDLVNLPGAERAEDIRSVAQTLARLEAERGIERPIGILANIESPRGLRCAAEIAAADPRVEGLQLGFGDLFEPLGIDRTRRGGRPQRPARGAAGRRRGRDLGLRFGLRGGEGSPKGSRPKPRQPGGWAISGRPVSIQARLRWPTRRSSRARPRSPGRCAWLRPPSGRRARASAPSWSTAG